MIGQERNLAMRCEHCAYPIFPYMLCCPSCSAAVESSKELKDVHLPQTRIGFWLIHLRHVVAAFAISLTSLFLSNQQR